MYYHGSQAFSFYALRVQIMHILRVRKWGYAFSRLVCLIMFRKEVCFMYPGDSYYYYLQAFHVVNTRDKEGSTLGLTGKERSLIVPNGFFYYSHQ